VFWNEVLKFLGDCSYNDCRRDKAWLQVCDLWTTLFSLSLKLCLSLQSSLPFLDFLVFFSLMVGPMKIHYFYVVEMIWIFCAVLDVRWIMGIRSLFNVCQQKATTTMNKKKKEGQKTEKERRKKKVRENIFCLSN